MSHYPPHNIGPIYTASFQTTALTTNPFDAIGILAPTNSRVCIHEISFGQPGVAALDRLGVQVLRGSTISSTSVAITPRHIHGWTGAPTAGSSVTLPCTTLVSTTSAVLLAADAFWDNVWRYMPEPAMRPILEAGQRMHVRLSAPSTAATGVLNGVLTFSEIGKPAST
jgi:hypothetical protein